MARRASIALLVLGVLFAMAVPAKAAPPPQPMSGWWELNNYNSRLCLVAQNVPGNQPAFQYPCWYEDRLWQFVPVGNGIYQIQNKVSRECLVVQGDATGNRAFTYSCAPSPTGFPYADQIWQALYKANQPPFFQLQNLNSGRCLVVQGKEPRTQAIQAGCNTRYLDQFWRQTRIGP